MFNSQANSLSGSRYSIADSNGVAREGLLLRLETVEGFRAYGELAPLPEPGFSLETLEEATQALVSLSPRLLQQESPESPEALREMLQSLDIPYPSLRWALELLFADAASQQAGLNLAAWFLSKDDSGEGPCSELEINGLLTPLKAEEQLAKALESGFRVLKLKVNAVDLREQVAWIRAQEVRLAGVSLRLDANRSLSLEDAQYLLGELAALKCIEYLEEPLKDPDLPSLRALKEGHPTLRIAFDETITLSPALTFELLDEGLLDVLVLKPLILGGIEPCSRLLARVDSKAVSLVLTSTMELGPGYVGGLLAAAVLGARVPLGACGFDTLKGYQRHFVADSLQITTGKIILPSTSALEPSLSLPDRWDRIA